MSDHSASAAERKRELLRELLRKGTGYSHHPVSPGQRALWLAHQLDPGSPAYNVISRWRIRSVVEPAVLRLALQELVDRHAALRTTFIVVRGEPVQRVHERVELSFEVVDAQGWDDARCEDALAASSARPFDLEQGPVFRARVFWRAADDAVLLLAAHHIAYDHWSLTILVRELQAIYDAVRAGTSHRLAPLGSHYTDYVRWQAELLASDEGGRLRAFWDERLSGHLPVLELPLDRPRPAALTFRGDSYVLPLPPSLTADVATFARAGGTTPYVVFLAAFVALLHRYTGQDDLVIGSPTAGRSRPEFADIVGFFVNPVLIRASIPAEASFATLASSVRMSVLDAMEHADLPFATLLERFQSARDASRPPLCQAAFTWDKLEMGDGLTREAVEAARAGGLDLEFLMGTQMGSNFDVDLIMLEGAASLEARWRYSTDIFDRETIALMAAHYIGLIRSAMAQPSARLATLSLIDDAGRARLLHEWNPAPPAAADDERTLVDWFERQVLQTPDAVAVSGDEGALTYAQLNARANHLAHRLLARGASGAVPVALCLERSVTLVASVLGILKSGCAYLPIDPAYPAERIQFMLSDADVRVVVTQESLEPLVSGPSVEVIRMNAGAAFAAGEWASNPDVPIDPAALAYVIYTSGSTGRPKGVEVEHRHVTRLMTSTAPWFEFTTTDVWTLFHSSAFDFSVWEIWGALLYGGRLVIVPHWVSRSPDAFRALLAAERVTVLNQTPSAFRQLIEVDERGVHEPLVLRLVIFGGEALDVQSLRPWVIRHGAAVPRLVNMYGITETTVHVTYRPMSAADILRGTRSVIGTPIPDLALYVLDGELEPAPTGLRGELVIGGAGVARGYLGRPRLTAERFIPDPFSGKAGARLYRSGDLGRRLPDGDVEYSGRLDQQVKIRGFRIELGEIQRTLAEHPAVREAVVLAQNDDAGGARLIAYLVPDATVAGTVRRLAAWERSGRLDSHSWTELPNGRAVVQLNRSETAFLYQEIFTEGQYLRHGIELAPQSVIFDVGANIGMFSLYVAEKGPGSTIFAFEPIPTVCDILRLNAELHGVDIRPQACGLSNEQGEATFTYYPNVSIFSGRFGDVGRERAVVEAFVRNQQADGADAPELMDELLRDRLVTQQVQCPLTTVSAVMRREGVDRIDLLKVDAEKSELAVLEGVDEVDWPRIRQVVVEVHDEHGRLNTVCSLLRRHGFHVATEQEESLAGTGLYSVYATREQRVMPGPADVARRVEWGSPGRLMADLRQHLGRTLPDYMVPSAFVILDALPLTSNGKLDRRALPAETVSRRASVEPRNALEEQIRSIWCEVLQTRALGVEDDFFQLGGHSLLATKVISRLRAATSVDVPLRTLFESPTIAGLALAIVQQQAADANPDAVRRALAEIEGL